ncbi:hypothetical protein MRX96_056750 [Rhipicephalus microplus]
MAFSLPGRRPEAFGYARFRNPEQPTSAVGQEERVSPANKLQLASRDSVTSDRFRQDWSRLRAASATDARSFELITFLGKKFEDPKAAGQQPPFPVLTIPKATKSCALETETVSGVSLTVGPVSSFSARGSCRTDTDTSECSSLTPFLDTRRDKALLPPSALGRRRQRREKRRAATGCRNPRHALLVVMAVMTGALLTVLLAAATGEFHIPAPGSPPRAAGVAAPADDSATTHGEAGHGDFLMPTSKRQNKRGIETATSEEVQKARPSEADEVAASAATEDVIRDDVNTTQVYSAAMGGYREIDVTGLDKSVSEGGKT